MLITPSPLIAIIILTLMTLSILFICTPVDHPNGLYHLPHRIGDVGCTYQLHTHLSHIYTTICYLTSHTHFLHNEYALPDVR